MVGYRGGLRGSVLVHGRGLGRAVGINMGLFVGGCWGVVCHGGLLVRRGGCSILNGGCSILNSGCSVRVLATVASAEQQAGENSGFEECHFAKKKSINESHSSERGDGDGGQAERLRFGDGRSTGHHERTSNNHGPLHCCWCEVGVVGLRVVGRLVSSL